MAFNYTNTQNTADRLITSFGSAATYEHFSPGTFNPITGTTTGATYTGYAVQAVIDNFNRVNIDNTVIKADDKNAIMSAKGLSVTPDVSGRFSQGGTRYTIISIRPTKPASTAVIYELQLRK